MSLVSFWKQVSGNDPLVGLAAHIIECRLCFVYHYRIRGCRYHFQEDQEKPMSNENTVPFNPFPEDEDDSLGCDCCDFRKKPAKGWKGKRPVPVDGNTWPLDFAAKMLECPERDLRDLVRIVGLEPAGTLKMTSFRRSGRHPRAYDASKLVDLWDKTQELIEYMKQD